MDVAAIIPAYNEADTIAATVEAVLATGAVTRVLVVDDGSSDESAARAQEAGAEVLRCERNLGKGAALGRGAQLLGLKATGEKTERPGPEAAPQSEAETPIGPEAAPQSGAGAEAGAGAGTPTEAGRPDIILLLDADLGASASEATELLRPVLSGLADMTIGVLPKPPGSGGFGVVKNLARSAIRAQGGGMDAQAPLSGQRALTRECLEATLPFAEGYGVEVALTIRALKQNLRVLEVMVNMRHRATGNDLAGILHRARQYLDVRRTLKKL